MNVEIYYKLFKQAHTGKPNKQNNDSSLPNIPLSPEVARRSNVSIDLETSEIQWENKTHLLGVHSNTQRIVEMF